MTNYVVQDWPQLEASAANSLLPHGHEWWSVDPTRAALEDMTHRYNWKLILLDKSQFPAGAKNVADVPAAAVKSRPVSVTGVYGLAASDPEGHFYYPTENAVRFAGVKGVVDAMVLYHDATGTIVAYYDEFIDGLPVDCTDRVVSVALQGAMYVTTGFQEVFDPVLGGFKTIVVLTSYGPPPVPAFVGLGDHYIQAIPTDPYLPLETPARYRGQSWFLLTSATELTIMGQIWVNRVEPNHIVLAGVPVLPNTSVSLPDHFFQETVAPDPGLPVPMTLTPPLAISSTWVPPNELEGAGDYRPPIYYIAEAPSESPYLTPEVISEGWRAPQFLRTPAAGFSIPPVNVDPHEIHLGPGPSGIVNEWYPYPLRDAPPHLPLGVGAPRRMRP
jgi:hypothetical protein